MNKNGNNPNMLKDFIPDQSIDSLINKSLSRSTNPLNKQISINEQCIFLPHESSIGNHKFVFLYNISIKNFSGAPIQLISRTHHVVDANKKDKDISEFDNEQLFFIKQQEPFEHSTKIILPTPVGSISSQYQLASADGRKAQISIPPQTIAMPKVIN